MVRVWFVARVTFQQLDVKNFRQERKPEAILNVAAPDLIYLIC